MPIKIIKNYINAETVVYGDNSGKVKSENKSNKSKKLQSPDINNANTGGVINFLKKSWSSLFDR